MQEQAFPSSLHEKRIRVVATNKALDPLDTIGPSEPDNVREWLYWGFSCYAANAGTVTVEYSYDEIVWRTLEAIGVAAGGNANRIYAVTRRWYRVSFTDTSDETGPAVDLSTIRCNNL